MKTKLWMLGMAVAALTSCTQSEVVEIPESRVIGFDTFVEKNSRAVVTETTGNLNEMYVVGYKTANTGNNPAFSLNNYQSVFVDENNGFVKAERDANSAWGYTPVRHWQKNSFYRFAAFTDANDDASDLTQSIAYNPVNDEVTITGMTVTNTTKDLVVAISGDRKTESELDASATAIIPFTFRHALSRVRFTFTDASNVNLRVKDLKIVNAYNKGTGTYKFNTQNTGYGDVTWVNVGTDTDKGFIYPTSSLDVTGANGIFDEMFVIPQVLGDSTNPVKVEFTLMSYSVHDGEEETIHETPFSLPLSTNEYPEWESGMWYTYHIAFGTDFNEIPISFTVTSVIGWNSNIDNNSTTEDDHIDVEVDN